MKSDCMVFCWRKLQILLVMEKCVVCCNRIYHLPTSTACPFSSVFAGMFINSVPICLPQLYKYAVTAVVRLLLALIIRIYSTQTARMKIGHTVRNTTIKPNFHTCMYFIIILYTFASNVLCKHIFSKVHFIWPQSFAQSPCLLVLINKWCFTYVQYVRKFKIPLHAEIAPTVMLWF